jgi:hypothetical protein
MLTAGAIAAVLGGMTGLYKLGQLIADNAVKRRPNGWLARKRAGKAPSGKSK